MDITSCNWRCIDSGVIEIDKRIKNTNVAVVETNVRLTVTVSSSDVEML